MSSVRHALTMTRRENGLCASRTSQSSPVWNDLRVFKEKEHASTTPLLRLSPFVDHFFWLVVLSIRSLFLNLLVHSCLLVPVERVIAAVSTAALFHLVGLFSRRCLLLSLSIAVVVLVAMSLLLYFF